ncbi:MAG: bifunctional (p)ppGpp synthetase/guanosine-3',5'-bis(diphosphate) 3'-pyrophosphohydrolase [Spirochaetaceae bacterium]|nr:MAG: bifunctional (p)ppGpp synthetase/guanosine-3',5'-bis(diphosphate) 3'-pyrophosphohydrolase [Spirochaetaceae bacterium]
MITSIEQLAEKIEFYSDEEQQLILKAAGKSRDLHEGQFRDSGEPYFVHPLQVAEILIDIRLDASTIIAALLHDVLEDTDMTRVELRDEFGKEVEQLVNGVTKIASVKAKNRSTQQSETIRKMLLAMVKDLRVILIKLADKLHNMRTLEYKTAERRKAIAQECLDLYAPLAGRLGIAWLKSEFEDLSLKNLNREEYYQIKTAVSQKRGERSDYLARVAKTIGDAATQDGLEVEVDARAKHFYSIYEKMKKRNRSIEEVYDLLGIRILCNSSNECYTVLGLVHRLWPPIEGRFKDYIAMPKSNRYQSLHTTVLAFGGRMLEIQIRTHDMHRTAEYGIAAHWLYKSGMTPETIRREELVIINRLKSMNALHITSNEFLEEIKGEILKDYIYVFTPQGDAIQLPRGATAIDFAYHIHTEIGDHISGAKADGQIIPLKNELKNTQVIEILTSPNAHPHLNWLRYVRTSRARSKVRHWLNKHEDNLFIDKSVVARKRAPAAEPPPTRKGQDGDADGATQQTLQPPDKVGVKIGDERNMMIRFAQCCTPRTGDDIVGYISRGRGIIVHKRGCRNLEFIDDFNERAVEVEWETVSPKATRRFRVIARKTSDLFSEIEGAVRKYHGHLIEGRVDENERGQLEAYFTMELESKDDFRKVMKNIRTVPSVVSLTES